VLGNRFQDGGGGARAVALGDVAEALVNGGLEGVQAFLRRSLVVEADDLELHAAGFFLPE
jgi:hypothetical protein